MNIKNKNFLVYGLSVSGEWVSKLLKKKLANVYLYDDNKDKLKGVKGCYLVNELSEELISQFDYIVVSPSIPRDNEYLIMAESRGIKIFSELEFSAQFCPKLVAVTGTNGKTTTVQLITNILNKKYKAVACGNIGYPLSRAVIEKNKYIKVAEVSSFMLEHADTFAPHVATVLNIEADHMIRHKTMEEYTRLKNSIYNNLSTKDYAVLNIDLNQEVDKNSLKITYSYDHSADVCVKDGFITLHDKRIVGLNELRVKGKHNIYDMMCAVAYGYIYKVSIGKMREALLEFDVEKYRIEFVDRINEIAFVNDSKSTNIASTLASVESVKGAIILLLGGSYKGLDYNDLFSRLSHRVVRVVVFGEISNELEESAKINNFEVDRFVDLNESFDYAVSVAKPNDTILLSPASASYDQFENYIERGKFFDNKVREYEVISKKK